MTEYCVVVADAARARLFTLDPASVPETQSGPNLVQSKEMVNPEKLVHEGEVFADNRGGRQGGSAHKSDDHRTQHEAEFEKRFARKVAAEAQSLVRSVHAKFLVIAAPPHMLGFLRRELDGADKTGLAIRETASSLTKLPPLELHEHLARERLLPERQKKSGK